MLTFCEPRDGVPQIMLSEGGYGFLRCLGMQRGTESTQHHSFFLHSVRSSLP